MNVELVLSVIALVATGAASWAAVRSEARQARKDVEALRKEMAGSMEAVREAIGAVRQLADEALRVSRKGHERVDAIEREQQRIDRSVARLDERWRMWRTTQRLRPTEDERVEDAG